MKFVPMWHNDELFGFGYTIDNDEDINDEIREKMNTFKDWIKDLNKLLKETDEYTTCFYETKIKEDFKDTCQSVLFVNALMVNGANLSTLYIPLEEERIEEFCNLINPISEKVKSRINMELLIAKNRIKDELSLEWSRIFNEKSSILESKKYNWINMF